MKVGVYDSGIGGKSVANAIRHELPDLEVVFVHDTPDHFPYATKTPHEIYRFLLPHIQSLIDDGCQAIVIACNTVSTTLIERLRSDFSVPFIAVEPMVKPAASLTKTGVIAVCATPTTLASPRYAELKARYASEVQVVEPDCADWSSLIENNQMNEARLAQEVLPALEAGADVIVLGCTHYHWIEREIMALAGGKAIVIQPEQAIIRQLRRVLAQLV